MDFSQIKGKTLLLLASSMLTAATEEMVMRYCHLCNTGNGVVPCAPLVAEKFAQTPLLF